MRWVINTFYFFGVLVALPWFLFKMATTGKYRRGLMQRLGLSLPRMEHDKPVIWVHAVSVGELQLSKALIAGLRERHPDYRIVITHTTRTGEDVAAQLYPDLDRSYSPLDFSFAVGRFFNRFKTRLVILIELELWPNFLLEAKRRSVPVMLANGRISARSASGYGRNVWFFRRPFSAITRAAVQNEEYAGRLRGLFEEMALAPDIVEIAGNLKFDNIALEVDPELRTHYRKLFGFADDELVLVCGSTHPGEHEILAASYKRWREAGLPLRMVIVPRHPERYASVRDIWKREGIGLIERSCLGAEARGQGSGVRDQEEMPPAQNGSMLPLASSSSPDPALRTPHSTLLPSSSLDSGLQTPDSGPPCILLDTMGELSKVYHGADIAFAGGSLIPHGGQNMAEPAGLGLPVLFGPHVHNFTKVVEDLLAARGAMQVNNKEELFEKVRELAASKELRESIGGRGRGVVQAGKGAITRHLDIVDELLKKL